MNENETIEYNAIGWVKGDIKRLLEEIRGVLTTYAEEEPSPELMDKVVAGLHQLHGTLDLLAIYGGVSLAEEMQALARAIRNAAVGSREEALEVLSTSLLYLPEYLEYVERGNRDLPLLVMPLLNDLRAARGAAFLSENVLFAPNLDAIPAASAEPKGPASGEDLHSVLQQQRRLYQLGLLGWLRGKDTEQNLKRMGYALIKLQQATPPGELRRLWWVCTAAIEALGLRGLAISVSIKQLLGQVDRFMGSVQRLGAVSEQARPPGDLFRNLVYYVAAAAPKGRFVNAVKQAYQLQRKLPQQAELEAMRAHLSRPNAELMGSVARVLREEMTEVNDHLDIFAHALGREPEELAPLAERLHRISETLGILGLADARERMQEQAARVQAMAKGEREADDQALLEAASALLEVDTALNEFADINGMGLPLSVDAEMSQAARSEYRLVLSATVREILAEMRQVEEAVLEYVGTPDVLTPLERVLGSLRQVEGALQIIPIREIVPVVAGVRRYLGDQVVAAGLAPDQIQLDALADAIISVQFYLDALEKQRGDEAAVLSAGLAAIAKLAPAEEQAAAVDAAPAESAAGPAAPGQAEPAAAVTGAAAYEDAGQTQADTAEPHAELVTDSRAPSSGEQVAAAAELPLQEVELDLEAAPEQPAVSEPSEQASDDLELAPTAQSPADAVALDQEVAWTARYAEPPEASLAPLAGEPDEEMLEIFREEMADVLGQLQELAPQWRTDPEDEETLKTIRRSFHTLKGSGRLVGAQLIGEFSAKFEHLLNKVIDGSVPPAVEIALDIEAAVGLLPAMLTQLTDNQPIPNLGQAMARADAMSDPDYWGGPPDGPQGPQGSPMADTAAADTTPANAGPAAPAPAGLASDSSNGQPPSQSAAEPPSEQTEAFFDTAWTTLPAVAEPAATAELTEAAAQSAPAATAELEQAVARELYRVNEGGAALAPDRAAHADPVLRQIFLQESWQYVQALRDIAEQWRVAETFPLPDEMFRLLHTLTGAARTAELPELGEPTCTLDKYLHCLRDQSPAATATALPLLDRVIAHAEQILGCLEQAVQPYPDSEPLVREISALTRSLVGEPSDTATAPDSSDTEEAVPAANDGEAAAPAANDGEQALVPAPVRVAATFEQVTETMSPSEQPDISADKEPALLDIFLEEATGILDNIEEAFSRWEQAPNIEDSKDAIEAFQRLMHTLKGSARMAEFANIGHLSHAIEDRLTYAINAGGDASQSLFDLLRAALDELANMVEQVNEGLPVYPAADLIAQLRAPENVPATAEDTAVLAAGPGTTLEWDDTRAKDPELVEIFLDESGSLLEAIDAHLQEWDNAPDDLEAVNELQRQLHTLKGSARMAGFVTIGDLSHAVEDRVLKTVHGEETPGPDLFAVLHEAVDHLGSMAQDVALGQSIKAASELIGKLADQSAVQAEPQPQAAPVEAQTQAAPSAAAASSEKAKAEPIRIRPELIDNLVNFAGEVNIYHSRLKQLISSFGFNLTELEQTIKRLQDQLRRLEIETEAQILSRHEADREAGLLEADFDPLEMDQYSTIQQLSRALGESVNDLKNIQQSLSEETRDSETLLLQQSRVSTDLQDGLMRTRMMRFGTMVSGLRRIVRQTANELGKQADLVIEGEATELDRSIHDRMTGPLGHILRNALSHGIEAPAERQRLGKPSNGRIHLYVAREGGEVIIRVSDDGRGMDLDAIYAKALERGLIPEGVRPADDDLRQMVLQSGFSTAQQVSQVAGRGVGMDVVNKEVKQLGGALRIDSRYGQGTQFTIRLPFTLAISQALLVETNEDIYAVPMASMEGVVRISAEDLAARYAEPNPMYSYADNDYEIRHMGSLLGGEPARIAADQNPLPMLLVRSGEQRAALQVESIMGSREIVVKPLGPQIIKIQGIAGATILGDGRVVLILDVPSLLRGVGATTIAQMPSQPEPAAAPQILVVDDSITIRKVTSRLLERNNFRVMTAKDGLDAVGLLQETVPDLMMLDVEMPRMDGYELATQVRNDPRLRHVPIIMVTSRGGSKHREKAESIGVNRYLGKPYQEGELLDTVNELLPRTDSLDKSA